VCQTAPQSRGITTPATLANSKSENIMSNSNKEACSYSLSTSLSRTCEWRGTMKVKFPNDPRNEKAQATLARIAGETDNLTSEEWDSLKDHYDWSSGVWADAISLASRRVEFRHDVRTFHEFVNQLIGILSEQNAAA
jgi:hypothetical protein